MSASGTESISATAAPPAAVAETWLFVLPWELHHPGGVNQVVLNLFDANERVLGGRSLLLVKTWDRHELELTASGGRATLRLPFRSPWSEQTPWRALGAFLHRLPDNVRTLRRLLKQQRVVCVHVHYPDLDALIWPLLRLRSHHRPKLVLSFHGVDMNNACAARGIGRWLWRTLLTLADEVVLCGDGVMEQLERNFPSARARARVIDNGVDPRSVRLAAQGKRPSQAPALYLCSLGTFEHKKGHDLTIAAFDALSERHPQLGLVIAGRCDDPAMLEGLEAQRRSLSAADRVLLLPNLAHADAMRWLAHSAVFVLASRSEPFGIVVLEAGVFVRPVVATSICGVVRRLRAGEELLVVPPNDSAALARAIERLLADPDLSRRLGEALRVRVESGFDWSRIVKQYVIAPRQSSPVA